MEKWEQDQIKELEKLNENQIREGMRLLKYGPPTSLRHRLVENYLNHLPDPIVKIPRLKRIYKAIAAISVGVVGSLLAWLILRILGIA